MDDVDLKLSQERKSFQGIHAMQLLVSRLQSQFQLQLQLVLHFLLQHHLRCLHLRIAVSCFLALDGQTTLQVLN